MITHKEFKDLCQEYVDKFPSHSIELVCDSENMSLHINGIGEYFYKNIDYAIKICEIRFIDDKTSLRLMIENKLLENRIGNCERCIKRHSYTIAILKAFKNLCESNLL